MFKNMLTVEVKWLQFLIRELADSSILKTVSPDSCKNLSSIYLRFDSKAYYRVKTIENQALVPENAVADYLIEQLNSIGLSKISTFVHFGCSYEDVYNLAFAKMLQIWIEQNFTAMHENFLVFLNDLIKTTISVPMVSSNGLTTLGKELSIYKKRLDISFSNINTSSIYGKLNGVSGNYSAAAVSFPGIDWKRFTDYFITNYIGITPNPIATAEKSFDYLHNLLEKFTLYNRTVYDLATFMKFYSSKLYFKSRLGSADSVVEVQHDKFDNCILDLSSADKYIRVLTSELAGIWNSSADVSLQKTLDGIFANTSESLTQMCVGLLTCEVNTIAISEDIENRWDLLLEAVSTTLLKYGHRTTLDNRENKTVSKSALHKLILGFDFLSEQDRHMLLSLTPSTYIGYAYALASN